MTSFLKGKTLKRIVKGSEPHSLKKYRKKFTTKELESDKGIYKSYSPKTQEGCNEDENANLRKLLLEQQGYICCYCMNIISCNYSKIEHYKPQSKFRILQVNYNNLFIACCGRTIDKKKYQTCDTYEEKVNKVYDERFCDTCKDNEELKYIDLLSNIEKNIKYDKYGVIYSENKNIDDELNNILNLNCKTLKKQRQETLDRLKVQLRHKGYKKSILEHYLKQYKNRDSSNKFAPYCEMIVYFLTKTLKSKKGKKQ